jgi:hypothetical protein
MTTALQNARLMRVSGSELNDIGFLWRALPIPGRAVLGNHSILSQVLLFFLKRESRNEHESGRVKSNLEKRTLSAT